MNVNNIKMGMMGSIFALAATSCVNDCEIEARKRALPYLTGKELLEADSIAKKQVGLFSQTATCGEVLYWDSIIAEHKAKEAYAKGLQMVKDSADRKFYRQPRFKVNTEKRVYMNGFNIIEKQRKEFAEKVNAVEFEQADKIAKKRRIRGIDNSYPERVHYYGLLMRTAKERDAFNKGLQDAREELKNQQK